MTRLTTCSLLLIAWLGACGEHERPALEGADPLHPEGLPLPPPAVWRPERAPEKEVEEIRVQPPPFTEGIFPCSRCHVGGAEVPDEAPAIPHKLHLDRDLVCIDCHDPDETGTPAIPAAEVCFECHEDLGEESERVQAYFKTIRKGDAYVFPRRWKTADVIANHPGHAEKKVSCEQCHGAALDAPFQKPKSVALMELCLDCHQNRGAPAECATCHKQPRQPRHGIVLKHAEEQRGCLDCHNPEDRDTLRLVSGKAIPFSESYVLCGQCHGPKLRDWKEGLHGKRTGMWDGKREYLLCVHCHRNPHAPQIPKMRPEPPPVRPEDIR